MGEITFEDILIHYERKLRETSEEIEDIKKILRDCIGILDETWSGDASNTFRVKVEGVNAQLTKSYGQLSEALTKLTAIKKLLIEG